MSQQQRESAASESNGQIYLITAPHPHTLVPRYPEMRSKAPSGLMEHLATPAFTESTMASFDKLDVNGSEKLEAAELAPVIVEMIGNIDDSGPMNLEQCMNFVGLVFDQDGDGVISRAEWFHLVEFVVVMNVLEASKTRTVTSYLDNSFAEASNSPDRKRTEGVEAENDGGGEGESSAPKSRVTPEMRGQIHDEVLALLASSEFVDNCMESFDSNGQYTCTNVQMFISFTFTVLRGRRYSHVPLPHIR